MKSAAFTSTRTEFEFNSNNNNNFSLPCLLNEKKERREKIIREIALIISLLWRILLLLLFFCGAIYQDSRKRDEKVSFFFIWCDEIAFHYRICRLSSALIHFMNELWLINELVCTLWLLNLTALNVYLHCEPFINSRIYSHALHCACVLERGELEKKERKKLSWKYDVFSRVLRCKLFLAQLCGITWNVIEIFFSGNETNSCSWQVHTFVHSNIILNNFQ